MGNSNSNASLEKVKSFFHSCEKGEGWEACKQYCNEDAVFECQGVGPVSGIKTIQEYTEWMSAVNKAVPDAKYEIHLMSSGTKNAATDGVSFFATFTGTHTVAVEGFPPPTNKKTKSHYVYVISCDKKDKKIAGMTKVWNDAYAMAQFGWPAPAPAPATDTDTAAAAEAEAPQDKVEAVVEAVVEAGATKDAAAEEEPKALEEVRPAETTSTSTETEAAQAPSEADAAPTSAQAAEMASYGFLTIHPTFTILDMEKAKPIMAEFVEATRTESGCVYYGWTVDGDKLFCREAYADGEAVNAHLKNVGPLIGKILESACKLDSIEIHGAAAELELVKPGTKDLGTKYFATDSGFTNQVSQTGAVDLPYEFMTVHPTFTILDMEKAKPIMAEFLEATRTESGCVYYGWTIDGDKLFCREAYANGEAVNAHLKNVGPLIGKILESACTLDSIEIHGPAAELELVKPGTKDLGTKYFATDSGFSRFTLRE